jgi:outer membrane beta-barrel protein
MKRYTPHKIPALWIIAFASLTLSVASVATGAEIAQRAAVPAAKKTKPAAPSAQKPDSPSAFEGEQINIDAIKERYWARGEESEIGVVQNRLYRKERKIEISLFGGSSSTDPFLSVRELGVSLGYHLNEYWAINAVYMRSFSSDSSASTAFQSKLGGERPPVDPPKGYIGGEVQFSPLYGKLSLLGQKIIYYDLHLLAGGGVRQASYGNYAAGMVGVGQQIYLAKWLALRVDYRFLIYKDNPRIVLASGGVRNQEERTNYSHSVILGFSFLFDLFGSNSAASSDGGNQK